MMDISNTVTRLHATLDALESGGLRPDVVCARFRVASLQWPDLPQRYGSVLERLLQPLDTAAFIGDEGCAYARTGVVGALRQWLDNAAALQQPVRH